MEKLIKSLSFLLLVFLSISAGAQQRSTPVTYDNLSLLSASLDSNKTVLVVKIGSPGEDYIEAALTHSIGWVVEKKKVKLVAGENRIRFDMSMSAEGNYRLLLRNNGGTWTVTRPIKK
ncbi:MAG: hypothetical protein ACKOA3_03245 [Sphingomonadales bacterium]